MDAIDTVKTVTAILVVAGRIAWWPIAKVINAVIYTTILLLSPFYNVITFILLPFIHLGNAIIRIISIPFSVKWLERIETLYVYLGTAGLIGCLTGAVLFLIFKLLSASLNIDAAIVPEPQEKGRTAAAYRAARREKEMAKQSPNASPVVVKKVTGPRRRGLLSQAIIEEEDSDF